MEIEKILLGVWVIFLGMATGFALGLAIRTYKEQKIHRRMIIELIDKLEDVYVHYRAEKLAGEVTDAIFGKDKPEDLEKAVKEVAKAQGLNPDNVVLIKKVKVNKKPGRKPGRKPGKKPVNKIVKKEK